MIKSDAIVPCGSCSACCKKEAVILHPECGDVIGLYETAPIKNPITGESAVRLKHKENGDCFYLTDSGCSIWQRRPHVCRTFDCRMAFLRFSRPTRKRMLKAGVLDQETIDAGRDRQNTLTDAQRAEALSRPRL